MAYLLFAGDDYYPQGGAEDLKGKFDSVKDARSAHDPTEHTYNGGWANILDLEAMEIVLYFDRGAWTQDRDEVF